MSTQKAAPLIYPALPDKSTGVIGVDPLVLQCESCGTTASAASLGLKRDSTLISVVSDLQCHRLLDGTAPRLCADCRKGRCGCIDCIGRPR